MLLTVILGFTALTKFPGNHYNFELTRRNEELYTHDEIIKFLR